MMSRDILGFCVIKKSSFYIFCFVIVFSFFASMRLVLKLPIPYVTYIEVGILLISCLFIVYNYVALPLLKHSKFTLTLYELYILLLIIFIPLYTAWRAYDTFGQPLIYGLLTQRSFFLAGYALIIFVGIKHGYFKADLLESILVKLAWLWISLCFFMKLFINPDSLTHLQSYFIGGSESHEKGFYIKYDSVLFVFGFIYYLFKGYIEDNKYYIALSLPFLLFIILVVEKRSLILSLAIAVSFLSCLIFDRKSLFKIFTKSVLFISVIGISLFSLFPEGSENYISRFIDAFSVVLTGDPTNDSSANARILELKLIWPFLESNWLIGNGGLSNYWNGGYRGTLGYFYPSDIGFFGSVFVFGFFVTLMIYLQYIFVCLGRPNLQCIQNDLLSITCYGVLTVFFVQSFIRSQLLFDVSTTLFFVSVIHGLGKYSELSQVKD